MLGMVWEVGGGGGGEGYIHKFCSGMDFLIIFLLFGNTKFVVTNNWFKVILLHVHCILPRSTYYPKL